MAAGITNVGLPYGAIVGYVVDGLYQTQAEVDEYNNKYDVKFGVPGVGRLRYSDVNGDKVIDTKDQAYIGSNLPKLQYGLTLSATYKNWDLSLFFSGMFRDAYNTSKLYTDFFPLGEGLGNHSTRLLDAMNAFMIMKRPVYTTAGMLPPRQSIPTARTSLQIGTWRTVHT